MNKEDFVTDLKKSLSHHYQGINEDEEILSYGIYTDGDASTIGIYYNTYEHLQNSLKEASQEEEEAFFEPLTYLFSMEEWKQDISEDIREGRLKQLNEDIYDFGAKEFDKGNENYKNEVFDLLARALKEFGQETSMENKRRDFFLHLDVSDTWIDEEMLARISDIHPENRFLEYQEYAKKQNKY